ncbi:D-alanyl-D-alanine carboxypeptidase family protein [Actinomadura rudentiformis]|uniref:D-alanyl-D-alanine carboxypeptidase n=1 Tax=Actinomadura rudentiformis TaxID=359158 RepID=A0A6H9YJU4_9ACTN|nr:serine hydrolase [Actinomadura rudentiformis]KAB2343031.1 D-alanyl-D-alanine carboxypeptidase [Actinomadura rudentiformis]
MGSTTRWTTRATVAVVVTAPIVTIPVSAEASPASVPAVAAPPASAAAGPRGVAAKSAYLFDSGTRKTRWSRAADTRRPIGSITKVMTAMVVIRAGKLDRKITVKKKHVDYVSRSDGSRAWLRVGDRLTVRQLLNALMLPSGCDAAYVLADAYGPGWKGFVAKMNKTARQLKMTRTKYANFDGLPWPSGTATNSTTRDQVKLADYAMKNKEFRAIVARRSYSLKAGGGHGAYRWTNTNRLLSSYRGTIGIKTGKTDLAGYSLMFAARRGKRTLIGVVLNSSTTREQARFTDAMKMLNWGFGVRTTGVLTVAPVPPGANVD